ncbi:MAG TPA: hypothetical protein VL326_24965 [Kofleriaceae bacterium]|jgi:hypothetical protein|nr:hypothetical protein [Kofleriaceae bacterium]
MSWRTRTRELHAELAALADPAPWWWLIAAGVAAGESLPQPTPPTYLACDAEPDADTLIAYRSQRPRDVVADAIARARAARTAILELDGTLPDQPLAVTLNGSHNARPLKSSLDVAAFAFGDRCVALHLGDPQLSLQISRALAGDNVTSSRTRPFVCVSVGDEPLETARHGHRRAWTERGGPWLGLGRAGDLAIVSTCHLVVDGYGHARLAARIAELAANAHEHGKSGPTVFTDRLPPLARVGGAVPLSIAWRDVGAPLPRVIPLAYRLGCILRRDYGRAGARFSPSVQVPVAMGAKTDPVRLHRRVVAATINVRFDERGEPEPFAAFEARVREVFAREAASRGLVSRLLAAARGMPAPLGWKRRGIAAKRPAWLEGFADVIGGRALLSRISVDAAIPLSYAVSSPSRLASADDPVGGCVISLVDDGVRGAITLCGSGQLAAEAILDELLSAVRAAA